MNINGVSITAFALAMTQAIKSIFGVKGKWNQVVAIVIAIVLTGLGMSIDKGLFGPNVVTAIEITVTSLVGGLSAIGLFDLGKQSWNARIEAAG